MKEGKQKKEKANPWGNKGSTFIVVIVAVSFLTVLGTIIIAVSSANLQMKKESYAIKRNFYVDEQVLDEVYHGIGMEAERCLGEAYAYVLTRITTDVYAVPDKDQEADAFRKYSEKFIEKLNVPYKLSSLPAEGEEIKAAIEELDSYIQRAPKNSDPTLPVLEEKHVTDLKKIKLEYDEKTGIPEKYIFQGVVVKYRETDDQGRATGYESTITTDIVIEIPFIDFFQDSSRILDYAMVANKGIYFYDTTTSVVTGNVYAGIDRAGEEKPDRQEKNLQRAHGLNPGNGTEAVLYGGLGFDKATVTFNSNYIITKGDINVRNSTVTIGNGNPSSKAAAQIWAETIRTVRPQDRFQAASAGERVNVTINGKIYAANDLEINADASTVKLEGEYYGYNGGRYVTWEQKQIADAASYDSSEHTASSAIIINGKEVRLDLAKLDVLVISGLAYVDLVSKRYSSTDTWPVKGLSEYATSESLAFKASQFFYLAPSDCLKTTNPVPAGEALPVETVWNTAGNKEWFGNDFIDLSSTLPPVTAKRVKSKEGGEYVYYYLNIPDGTKKLKYIRLILNMPMNQGEWDALSPDMRKEYEGYGEFGKSLRLKEIQKLKGGLQEAAKKANITITDIATLTGAKFFAPGTVMSAQAGGAGVKDSSSLLGEKNKLPAEYTGKLEQSLAEHYKRLYMELDPSEGTPLTAPAPSPTASPNPYADLSSESYPMNRFVRLEDETVPGGLLSGLTNAGNPSGEKTSYRNSKNESIISNNKGQEAIEIKITEVFNGIILCTGDVIVRGKVKGLIVAGGKIYVEQGGEIEANRSAVLSILEEEIQKESAKSAPDAESKKWAVYYLKDIRVNHLGTDNAHRISGTNYTEFMGYANWRKGEIE